MTTTLFKLRKFGGTETYTSSKTVLTGRENTDPIRVSKVYWIKYSVRNYFGKNL